MMAIKIPVKYIAADLLDNGTEWLVELSDVWLLHYAGYLHAVISNVLHCGAGMFPFPPGGTKTKVASAAVHLHVLTAYPAI